MLRSGPIAFFLHGLLEYVAAIGCFLAPFAFDFRSDAATTWSFVAGVLILLVALTTDGPARIVARLPIMLHVVLDYALAAAFIASPWVLGFAGEAAPRRWFVTLGVAYLLLTLLTRYVSSTKPHVGALAAGTSAKLEAERGGY